MLDHLIDRSELAKIKYLYTFHYDKNGEPAIEKLKVAYINPEHVLMSVPGCNDIIHVRLDQVFEDFEEFTTKEDFAVVMARSINNSFSIFFYKNPNDDGDHTDHLSSYMIERLKSVYQSTMIVEKNNRSLFEHYAQMSKEREDGLKKCKEKKKEIYDLLVLNGSEIPDFIKEDQENG